jgi:hypothetical protein
MGDRSGLTRVGRGEPPAPRLWVNRIDDPARARLELESGTCGVDVARGELRMRVGGLPLIRRVPADEPRRAVRAIIEWPHEARTVTMTLRSNGVDDDERDVTLQRGRNRALLFARDDGTKRSATVVLRDGGDDLLRAEFALEPERAWTVYFIHHSHLDVGYTDPQETVLRNHRSYLDQVLDLASATDSWPDDSKFRWNIEANWPLQQWLRTRSRATVDTMFDLVRAGRVEIAAMPFTMHTEACSIDELAHTLRFVDELRTERGIEIPTAMQTDVPGLTVGFAQLLADVGVRYLSVSHNYAGRSVPHHLGGQDLTRPFYWQTPAGDRLLTWFGDTPHGMAYMEGTMLGLTEGYDQTVELLPEYLAALAGRPYPYAGALSDWWRVPSGAVTTKKPYPFDILQLRLQGAYCDNAGPNIAPAEVIRKWNEEWEYPRLRLATNADFFQAAEERLGDQLATHSGDWTDWWADGLGSAARLVGSGRRTQASIRSAQSLHTVADQLGAETGADLDADVDTVFGDLALFDEHTWGSAEPWEDTLEEWYSGPRQWHAKSGFALSAEERTHDLIESGLERLGSRLTLGNRTGALVVVFNPTMAERTDLASVFVPASRFAPSKGFGVIDLVSGERVPCTTVAPDPDRDRRRSRGQDLTFLAAHIPPFGYRAFALVDEVNPADAPTPRRTDTTLENANYEVGLDLADGCITTLTDRRTGLDLIGTHAIFGFGQFIHDRFTTAPRFNHLSSKIEARDLELLGERTAARFGALIDRSSTPLWERVTVRFAAPGTTWLDLSVTLPHGIDRIDLQYRLSKPDEESKESAYIAFPFNAPRSGLRAEITGGVHTPHAPHIPGSAEHMRAVRHWIGLHDQSKSIAWTTVEAPLIQVGNLHLPYAPFPTTLRAEPADTTTVYSWLFNNIWDTNFPSSQGGEMSFRYAISSAGPDAGDGPARALAADVTTPLLATVCGSLGQGVSPTGSFCETDGNIEVLALRKPHHGHDLSVLVHTASDSTQSASLRFPGLHVRAAWIGDHCDHEVAPVDIVNGAVRVTFQPGTLCTVLLDLHDGS